MSAFKFRPSLESLTDRVTPSVTVLQVGSELVITGDKDPDVVRLHDNGQGQIIGFGTGVGFFIKNGVEKITVNTHEGNDVVDYTLANTLQAYRSQRLTVNLDSAHDPVGGNDQFNGYLKNTSLAGGSKLVMIVAGNRGHDTLSVDATGLSIRPTATLQSALVGGEGNDRMVQVYDGLNLGRMTMRIHGEAGNDHGTMKLTFKPDSTGDVAALVTGGDGDDKLSLHISPAATNVWFAQAEGNAGDDTLDIGGPVVGIP